MNQTSRVERVERPWVRPALIGAGLAAIVAAVGWAELGPMRALDLPVGSYDIVIVLMAAAVGLHRLAPAAALVALIAATLVQVEMGLSLLIVQLGFVVVLYGCSRYGGIATVVLSGLAIPGALGLGVVLAGTVLANASLGAGTWLDALARVGLRPGPGMELGVVAVVGTLLVVPWLVGLTLRFADRARESRDRAVEAAEQQRLAERGQAQAEAAAGAQEERARLARDVHDVVGHSLAVILAQAQAATLLPDAELPRIRRSLEAITDAARTSLDDVGAVLAGTSAAAPTGGFGRLVAQTAVVPRVEVVVEGEPRPLPPDVDVVAERVLRELVANALKHGDPDAPIRVRIGWGPSLGLEVVNRVASDRLTVPIATGAPRGGTGLDGVRRRLGAVGGRLEVTLDDGRHHARALVPLLG